MSSPTIQPSSPKRPPEYIPPLGPRSTTGTVRFAEICEATKEIATKVMNVVKDIFSTIKEIFFNLVSYVSKTLNAMFVKIEVPAKFEGVHTKAITEKGNNYPDRFPVPKQYIPWNVEYPEYKPTDFTHQTVIENDRTTNFKGWADPADFNEVRGQQFLSYQGAVQLDQTEGKPLNPIGRTGIVGRGLLGKWGANQAGDPVVTRVNPTNSKLEILLVQRKDNGEWAIPGGMQDPGELISKTCKRELLEETMEGTEATDIDFSAAPIIYQGYVDDPRNTDNAWMETSVIHVHLTPEQAIKQQTKLKAGDDAAKAQWHPLTKDLVDTLYASHPHFVKLTVNRLDSKLIESCTNKQELLQIKNRA